MYAVWIKPAVDHRTALEGTPIIPQRHLLRLGYRNNCRVVVTDTLGVADTRRNGTQYWNHPRGYAFLHNRRQLRAKGIYVVVALQIVGAVHDEHNAGLFAFEFTQQRRVVGRSTSAGEWVEDG